MAIKHYFAAGFSAFGFVNYFDYINNSAGGYTYILKGGPGTGKSTLIKKIGRFFEKVSDIEYFYCASDPESLDGVKIVSKNAAIVDGTAPHVTEAQMPGVKDEIINLGQFIGSSIRAHKNEIERLLEEKKYRFKKTEHYLKAAGEAYKAQNSEEPLIESPQNFYRKLFLSAIDKSVIDLNKYKKILTIGGPFDGEIKRLINRRAKGAFFSSILNPDIFEALEIDGILIKNVSQNCEAADSLLELSKKELAAARAAHKQIESFYVPCMDFNGLNKTAEYLKTSIEALAF